MKRSLVKLVLGVLILTGAWAVTAWPRLNDVETGRTPEYPDLQVRRYDASPQRVAGALESALSARAGWTVVGSGKGPAGSAISAVHETPLLQFKDDVTVQIDREDGLTTVSVRSRSRIGGWDFGQNARNIRELFAALEEALQ